MIDTWDLMNEHGDLIKRARDSHGDGRFDQSWTFDPTRKGCATVTRNSNGDGQPDAGAATDACRQLSDGGQ